MSNVEGMQMVYSVYGPTQQHLQLSFQTEFDLLWKPIALEGASTLPDGPRQLWWDPLTLWYAVIYSHTWQVPIRYTGKTVSLYWDSPLGPDSV